MKKSTESKPKYMKQGLIQQLVECVCAREQNMYVCLWLPLETVTVNIRCKIWVLTAVTSEQQQCFKADAFTSIFVSYCKYRT